MKRQRKGGKEQLCLALYLDNLFLTPGEWSLAGKEIKEGEGLRHKERTRECKKEKTQKDRLDEK